jgi:transcriptional regulator
MYTPASFAESRVDVLHDFIRQHPLAALVSGGSDGLEANHVPMVLDAGIPPSGVLRCHLARANPQWRTFASSPAVLAIFQGAEHYITPSWYAAKKEHGKVVPTWNYTAVHVWGRARLFEAPERLIEHLEELTAQNESSFSEPWSVADAPRDFVQAMTKAIVGVEIAIERIEGKWKASQNRSSADQQGVVKGLEDIGSEGSLGMARIVFDRNQK